MRMKQVMKEDPVGECDYTRKVACLRSFGSPERLGSDPRFKVPWVWDGSTNRVLVMEYIEVLVSGETRCVPCTIQDQQKPSELT